VINCQRSVWTPEAAAAAASTSVFTRVVENVFEITMPRVVNETGFPVSARGPDRFRVAARKRVGNFVADKTASRRRVL